MAKKKGPPPNRELKHPPKKSVEASVKNKPLKVEKDEVHQEPEEMDVVAPDVTGVVVHLSRVQSSTEQFMTKGVLQDVQGKFLSLLSKVDKDHSIAIGLCIVPSDFEFPMTEEEKENAAKVENTSHDNSGPQSNGSKSIGTQTDGVCEEDEGDVTEGSGDTAATAELDIEPVVEDPFIGMNK